MKLWVLLGLYAYTASAQTISTLPTKQEAAKAYEAYEEAVCRVMIDVCDGIASASPEGVERLACRRERQGTSTCRFEYANRRCRARFVMSEDISQGWVVAFRNRVPKGPDIECHGAR